MLELFAVLQSLSHVSGGDGILAGQVGNGAGNFEDAVHTAGGNVEAALSGGKEGFRAGVDSTVFFEFPGGKFAVRFPLSRE